MSLPTADPLEQPDLPEVIARYQAAHDARDTPLALATFAPAATVVDDGRTHRGTDEIRAWLSTEASEYTFTRTTLGARPEGAGWRVVSHLEGDFPGGVVDLRYRFELADGLITRLEIAP